MTTTFGVLTVCTGNICRSPLVEQLFRASFGDGAGITVSSAGTGALVGRQMPEQAQALSLEFGGIDPSAHTARQLTADHLRDADLVVALSREHRRAIVELLPRATRYTFTLRELARLLKALKQEDFDEIAAIDPAEPRARLALLLEIAASMRGMVEPSASPDDDDVVDPYKQSDAVYRASADQMVPSVRMITSVFARVLATEGR
jgi:protein-tyrosine phosphatase